MAVRAKLRKETDPEFWRELIASENPVPSEIDRQTEDIVDSKDDLVEDDSDVPLAVLIQELTQKKVCKGFAINDMGVLVADSEAERIDSTTKPVDDGSDNADKELGRGKRKKHPNRFYHNSFWCHDNNNCDGMTDD